jgi:diguanylate cyclase (GGDEF)-like protein
MSVNDKIFFKTMRLFGSLLTFFLPGGLVVLAAFLVTHFNIVPFGIDKIERAAPYVILALGIILGLRFHRSRLAFVIIVLFLSERSLFYFGTGGVYASGYGKIVLLSNGILLPLNLAFYYLVRERSFFSPGSIARIFFILLQPLAVFLLLRFHPELFQYLSHQFVRHIPLHNLPLTQPVLLVYGAILLAFFIGSLLNSGGPIGRGFFWSLVATLLALIAKDKGLSATLYFCGAGLIIIIAVIETAYAMAFQDELTGLPARRSLNTAMRELGRNYAIAMLDIDYFKKFNDRFGHDVGDQVLRMVAAHLKRVGGGGKPYRYGGEEFSILFPGKSKEEVIPSLDLLRQSIEAAQFVVRGKNRPQKPPPKIKKAKVRTNSVSVTVSIGVAEPNKKNHGPDSVMKAADQALYRAKKKGRNCIST